MLIVRDGSLTKISNFLIECLRSGDSFSYSWVNRGVGDGYPLEVLVSLIPSLHLSA
jgi:hypothetical protein